MNQHKTVCLITTGPHDDLRLYEKEARTLLEYGYQVTILCTDTDGMDSAGIRFSAVKAGSAFQTRKRLLHAARQAGADYYHLYGSDLQKLARPLQRLGKVIFEPAGLESGKKPGRRALRKVYGVLVSSQKQLNRYKPYVRRTVLIHDYPAEGWAKERQFSRIDPSRAVLCRSGDISEAGGLLPLLAAAQQINCRLLLSGGPLAPAVSKRIGETAGGSVAYYCLPESKKEFRKQLACATAGVVTPLQDPADGAAGLPPELFFCMAQGLPVITSHFAAFRSLVEGNNCGICVDPASAEEISAAVSYLSRNPDIAAEMSANGQKAVRNGYLWEKERMGLLYHFLSD